MFVQKYCFGRLFRGLASKKATMRESCAVTLASLLERTTFLKPRDFIPLMDEHLKMKEDLSEKVSD